MPTRLRSTLTCLLAVLATLVLGCAEEPADPPEPPRAVAEQDALETVTAEATPELVAERLVLLRRSAASSPLLAERLPGLDRETAYEIQRLSQEIESAGGNVRRGYKMGGTRITDPEASPDPVYGYSLASNVFESSATVDADRFVDRTPLIEAEVAVWIGEDLPGPEVSREELEAAIEGVSGAIELVTVRMTPRDPDGAVPMAYVVADNVAHAAAVVSDERTPLGEVDLDAVEAHVLIDGEERARGNSDAIMADGELIEAVLWLANELPRHDDYLRAGEFVLTGSLYDNPPLRPGEEATVVFSDFDTVRVALAP